MTAKVDVASPPDAEHIDPVPTRKSVVDQCSFSGGRYKDKGSTRTPRRPLV